MRQSSSAVVTGRAGHKASTSSSASVSRHHQGSSPGRSSSSVGNNSALPLALSLTSPSSAASTSTSTPNHHHINNNITSNSNKNILSNSSSVFCLQSIRCTLPNCSCQCFEPGTKTPNLLRVCDACHHSWVVHALDKLRVSNPYQMAHAEPVTSSSAFDVASLALYGTRAIPIRVKLLLDRIFAQLPTEHLLQLLTRLNWTHDDYVRGYMQVDSTTGSPVEQWSMATRDEEAIIIQQFFRFAETKSIAHELLLQDAKDRQESFQQAISLHSAVGGAESQIRRFLEASGLGSATQGAQNMFQASAAAAAVAAAVGGFAAMPTSFATGLVVPPPPPPPPPAAPSAINLVNAPATSRPLNSIQTSPLALFQNRSMSFANNSSNQSSEQLSSTGLPLNLVKKERNSSMATPANNILKVSSRLSLIPPPVDERNSVSGGDESFSAAIGDDLRSSSPSIHHNGEHSSSHRSHGGQQQSSSNHRAIVTSSGDRSSYGYGGTIVSPTTGKKRVLCQACGKTFCDKGALKIHYSAVHLREMHRCSIPGCNMYFSSRRSRNRHSANPNPKLHSPYRQRVVIDGRSSLGGDASGGNAGFDDNASSTSENRRNDANNSMVSDGDDRDMVIDDCGGEDGNIACVDDDDDGDDSQSQQQSHQQQPTGSSQSMSQQQRFAVPRSRFGIASSVSDDENGGVVVDELGSSSSFQDNNGAIAVAAPPPAKRRKSAVPVRVVRFRSESADEGDDMPPQRPQPQQQQPQQPKSQSPNDRLAISLRDDDDDEVEEEDEGMSRSPSPNAAAKQRSSASSPSPSSVSSHGNSVDVIAAGDQHVEPALEIPVDPNNPRQCPTCKKYFQNPFSMRLHYQNVHLKVKHFCTVPGCNSVFPSKRSRDRHASNVNLHRRNAMNGGSESAVSPSLSPAMSVEALNAANTTTPPIAHSSSSSTSTAASPPFNNESAKDEADVATPSWSSQPCDKNSQAASTAAITAV